MTAPGPSSPEPAGGPILRGTILHGFLLALWIPFFLALLPTWLGGTYYSYGILVPAGLVFCYLRRRDDAPPLETEAASPVSPGVVAVFLGLGLIAISLLRLLEGGNVHWRLPLWSHGAVVMALTLLALVQAEGVRRTLHFAPVLLLAVLAIPLPSGMEQGLVQGLTESVVETGGGIAVLLGLPVEIVGIAFVVEGRPVDVNDGCSGIRSFQSSLMAGVFVGELLRLTLPSRVTLLLIAVAAAFTANAIRVVALVEAFARQGHEGIDQRHDSAGFLALALTYGTVIGAGFLLDRFAPDESDTSSS